MKDLKKRLEEVLKRRQINIDNWEETSECIQEWLDENDINGLIKEEEVK